MREIAQTAEDAIVVEVRLSDAALSQRISGWIDQNPMFALGPAATPGSVLIADHMPEDAVVAVILIEDEEQPGNWRDTRVMARISNPVDFTKLRIVLEAAAHGMSVRDLRQASLHDGSETVVLTNREKEVLQLLGEGASNKVIARTLAISGHTVKFHVASLLEKLGASSRTEAVMTAVRLGLFMI